MRGVRQEGFQSARWPLVSIRSIRSRNLLLSSDFFFHVLLPPAEKNARFNPVPIRSRTDPAPQRFNKECGSV